MDYCIGASIVAKVNSELKLKSLAKRADLYLIHARRHPNNISRNLEASPLSVGESRGT